MSILTEAVDRFTEAVDAGDMKNAENSIDSVIAYINSAIAHLHTDEESIPDYPTLLDCCHQIQDKSTGQLENRVEELWLHVIGCQQATMGFCFKELVQNSPLTFQKQNNLENSQVGDFFISGNRLLIHKGQLENYRIEDFSLHLSQLLNDYPNVCELKIIGKNLDQKLERPLLKKLFERELYPQLLLVDNPLRYLHSIEDLYEIAPHMTCLDFRTLKEELGLRWEHIGEVLGLIDSLSQPKLSQLFITPPFGFRFFKVPESLHKFDCLEGTMLKALDFTGCEQLEEVNLSGCSGLTDIDFSKFEQVQKLNLSGCSSFTDIDLSNFEQLQELDLSGCSGLKTLKVNNLSQLRKLNLSGCSDLTEIDLSGCEQLQKLDISEYKNLTTIKLINCKWLQEFCCLKNRKLKTLDLSGCEWLQKFDCSGCWKLIILNLFGCKSLQEFKHSSCRNLTGVDLSDCCLLQE